MRSTAELSSASESIQQVEINLGRPKFKFYVAYCIGSTAELSSASELIQLKEINLGRLKFKFNVPYEKHR